MACLLQGCNLLKEFPQDSWGVDPEVLQSDTRVLDVLLHNSDRHHGHFLLGPHWALDGMLPVLIDHAASFRCERGAFAAAGSCLLVCFDRLGRRRAPLLACLWGCQLCRHSFFTLETIA
jgi:hypothetical protein